MIVRIDKSFVKDTDKITNRKIRLKIAAAIEAIEKAASAKEIKDLKKLKGYDDHYRIKFSAYRAGIIIRDNEIIFERFLHRKEIYRYYPR